MRPRALSAVLALVVFAATAAADVVHLRGGRRLVGRIVDDGDPVRLEVSGGVLTLPRSRVERIERGELPSEAYDRRLAALADDEVPAMLALAETALAEGLPEAAERALARAESLAPQDADVRRAMWSWRAYHRRLPHDDAAAERLLRAVGEDAHLLRTTHWRIAHDTTVEIARERAAALEDVWHAFHKLMDEIGLRPEPVDDRLEALLFADHTEWAVATRAPAASLEGLNGLYVGPTGRILLFDPETAPEGGRAQARIADAVAKLAEKAATLQQQEEQLHEIRARVEAWRPAPTDREGARLRASKLEEIDGLLARIEEERDTMNTEAAEIEAFRERVRRFWSEETVAATMHEACHQVAHATGIGHPEHPLWLSEGLATLFEATSRAALDPRAKHSPRLRDVRALRAVDGAFDLRRLVSGVTFAGATSSSSSRAYAEAWSLLCFLVHRHPDGLALALRDRPRADASVDPSLRDLRAFEEAFGDLDEVERDWRRFVERL